MMEPITRKEMFMDAAAKGDTSGLPVPVTREEMYLYIKASGDTTGILEPITRREIFWHAMCIGDASGLPDPVTREEIFLLAAAEGDASGLPDPVTREEMYLKAIAEQAKTVYTIQSKQAGAGEPRPDNIRPILPGLTLVRDDDSVLEVYGGTLDTASGVLTVTHEIITNDGTVSWMIAAGFDPIAFYRRISGLSASGNVVGVFSHFRLAKVYSDSGYGASVYEYNGPRISVRFDDDYSEKPTTADEMKAWCMTQAQRGTPFQAVYPLATPVTYQLTQAEVKRAVRELRR